MSRICQLLVIDRAQWNLHLDAVDLTAFRATLQLAPRLMWSVLLRHRMPLDARNSTLDIKTLHHTRRLHTLTRLARRARRGQDHFDSQPCGASRGSMSEFIFQNNKPGMDTFDALCDRKRKLFILSS